MPRLVVLGAWTLSLLAGALAGLAPPALAGEADVAVIIGNRNYQGRVPAVSFAHRDADAFRRYAIDTLGVRPENVIDLRDATQAQLYSVFGNAQDHRGRLWSFVKPGVSDVVVYYSGHGVPGQRDRRGYLLPSDADAGTPEINGYPLDTLYANLAQIEARSVRVFIDACFSGDSQGGTLIESASPVHLRAKPASVPPGLVVLTAAQADQLASWDTDAKHGLFTHHLLAALRGAADAAPWGDGDGTVSLGEVHRYLDDEMTYAARRRFQREQRATIAGPSEAPLAKVVTPAAAVATLPPAPAAKPALAAAPAPPAPPAPPAAPARKPAPIAAPAPTAIPAPVPAPGPAATSVPAQTPPAVSPPPAPAREARLPPHDGRWSSEDGRLSLVVTGGSAKLSFRYRGLTHTTTVTIDAEGNLGTAYINLDLVTAVQFRGRLPDIGYEIFGRDFEKGTLHLRRNKPS